MGGTILLAEVLDWLEEGELSVSTLCPLLPDCGRTVDVDQLSQPFTTTPSSPQRAKFLNYKLNKSFLFKVAFAGMFLS